MTTVNSTAAASIASTAIHILANKEPNMTLRTALEGLTFIVHEAAQVSDDANGLLQQHAMAIVGTAVASEKLPPWN